MAHPVKIAVLRAPWPELADGEWWQLDEGVDYPNGKAAATASTARTWAWRNGYRIEQRITPTAVVLRFTPKES